jgi:hypothetical protein
LLVSTEATVSTGGATTARRRRDEDRLAGATATASSLTFLRGLVRVGAVASTTTTAATVRVTSRARRARARAGRVSSAVPRSTGSLGPAQTCGAASRKTVSVTLGTSTPSPPALRFAIV